MKKKRTPFFMVLSLVPTCVGALTVALFSSQNAKGNVVQAENEQVTFNSIAWNNIDYSSPINMPAPETHYIPQYGYCIMLKYSKYFNPVSVDNFAYTHPEYSSHILVNGTSINEIEGCVVKILSGNLFVYFPASAVNYVEEYFRPTLEIEENTSFYGSILPYNKFEYKDSIGKNAKWENTTDSVRSNVTYSKIEWNNTYYGTSEQYPYCYGKNALLIKYSDVLSTNSSENGGAFVQERNLKNTVLGSNIKLNGTYFKDIANAEIRYFNQQFLWLYTPNMTVALPGERFAKIEISSTSVFDKNIPAKSFYFVNNKWVDNLTVATFSSLAWNNIDYVGIAPNLTGGRPNEGYLFALQYVEHIGDNNLNTNMANSSYDIGSHLLINGVPCKDVTDAIVGSYSNVTLLYVYFPEASISYHDQYDRPTVEIETDCMFGNYILPAIKLEFCAGLSALNGWNIEPAEADNPFTVIDWNNISYGGGEYEGKNGLLLSYTNNLSNYSNEAQGNINTRNLASTDIGKNIKINGVSLSDTSGGEVKYFALNHLWIYTPTMTAASNGYSRPQLSLDVATSFLDSIISPIQLIFKENKWNISNEDVLIRTSFTGFYQDHNNLDLGNTYRDTILCFANNFYSDSSKNNTDLKAADEEFVNKVTLNGVPLKNVPGIYVIYMGNNYIHLMIREVDLQPTTGYPATELAIPQDTHLFNYFINDVIFYLDSNSMQWMTAQNGVIINTLSEATFVTTGTNNQIAGMRFESRINKSMFDVQVSKYGLENLSFGTYIVPRINYKNSNAASPIDYINYNTPSNSTYLDIPDTGKDFNNSSTVSADGYYCFTGTIYNVKSSHYADGFIGVGYLKVGDRTYYGNVTDNSTTYYELLVQAYNQGLISSSYFNSILSFNTTANAYELTDVSLISNGYTVSYANKGYYSLNVSKEIRTIVIDGVPHKVNLKSGNSTYFAFYNDVIDFRSSLEMSKGIGEPIYELFPDTTNSNADLNTADNVSSLNQAFGSNAERIWLDLKSGLGIDSYSINQCDDNGEFRFDATKVARLHNYLAKFTSKGTTELTLLISGWANDKDAPVFLKNNSWLTPTEAYATTGATFKNIIPAQTSESYQKWLDANEGLAYKIAKEFTEFKYIETINEIDGGGYQYAPTYVTNETKPTISTMAQWSMDLCHAYSKGIRRAESNLKVMSPAFSCLDSDGNYHPYNTKNFISSCYSYIESSSDPYTNNWFQVMNLHPYVFPSKSNVGEDSVYLWNTYPVLTNNYAIDNADYDTDWVNYMNYVHNTIMAGHGDTKKSVAITEFGFSDMNGTTDSHWKYVNRNNRFNTIATNMMNKINSLNYIETLIWFRMFDFQIGDPASAFGGCLEPNFGLIETDKTLKELGKVLYQLWNGGSTDYSNITSYLSTMEGRN